MQRYTIPWTNEMEDDDTITNWLQGCIGRIVGSVELYFSSNQQSWKYFFQQLLVQVRFKSLRIHTDTITNHSA